jgi:hypothetical protein
MHMQRMCSISSSSSSSARSRRAGGVQHRMCIDDGRASIVLPHLLPLPLPLLLLLLETATGTSSHISLVATTSSSTSLPPATCASLTGWWFLQGKVCSPFCQHLGSQGIVQNGTTLTVENGAIGNTCGRACGVGNGTVSVHSVTMDFEDGTLTGALSADCKTLKYSDGTSWMLACADPPGHLSPSARQPCGVAKMCCAEGEICARTKCITKPVLTKIHAVFMTHLDLGFTNSTRNVCDSYFNEFFPAALAVADALRRSCTDPSTCPVFRWTEFPVSTLLCLPALHVFSSLDSSVSGWQWIIQEFLDGGTGCAHTRRTPEQVAAMEVRGDRVISDCHFAVQLNHFRPIFLSYSVAVFLK